jgi:hypothetical protein
MVAEMRQRCQCYCRRRRRPARIRRMRVTFPLSCRRHALAAPTSFRAAH